MIINWDDVEALALLLQKSYPDVDPHELELPELSQLLLALPGIASRQGPLNEEFLEAIQEAWNDEFEGDRT
jgi:FeS assembly protein IscX